MSIFNNISNLIIFLTLVSLPMKYAVAQDDATVRAVEDLNKSKLDYVAPEASSTNTAAKPSSVTASADLDLQGLKDELARCEEHKMEFAKQTVTLVERLKEDASNKCDEGRENASCQGKLSVQKSANAKLIAKFKQCQETLRSDPRLAVLAEKLETLQIENQSLQESADALGEELEKTKAVVVQAEERLKIAGMTLAPGFSYANQDAYGSFVILPKFLSLQPKYPRLDVADCEKGLEWLKDQRDEQEWYRLAIWAWQDTKPLLCERTTNDAFDVLEPNSNDEAHLIYFR